jgi:hypothetical protein
MLGSLLSAISIQVKDKRLSQLDAALNHAALKKYWEAL